MLTADQSVLFVLALVGLVSLVPLSVWLGTGRLRAAVRALQSYSRMLFVLVLFIGAGAVVGLIAALTT